MPFLPAFVTDYIRDGAMTPAILSARNRKQVNGIGRLFMGYSKPWEE